MERMKTMFAIGKLPPEILEKIVMEPMQASRVKREDVICARKREKTALLLIWAENTVFCPQTHYGSCEGCRLSGGAD